MLQLKRGVSIVTEKAWWYSCNARETTTMWLHVASLVRSIRSHVFLSFVEITFFWDVARSSFRWVSAEVVACFQVDRGYLEYKQNLDSLRFDELWDAYNLMLELFYQALIARNKKIRRAWSVLSPVWSTLFWRSVTIWSSNLSIHTQDVDVVSRILSRIRSDIQIDERGTAIERLLFVADDLTISELIRTKW